MGIVLQAQRRAIEALREDAKPLPQNIESTEIFSGDGERLYIAGVSHGIGTCSDLFDMDVLVLCGLPPRDGKPRIPNGASIGASQYAVLLRSPTERELKKSREYLAATCLLTVELLEPIEASKEKIVFRLTGRSRCYAHF